MSLGVSLLCSKMIASVLLVWLILVVPACSQTRIIVTWNGIRVNGPMLIYHDEMTVSSTVPPFSTLEALESGALACNGLSGTVRWHLTQGSIVNTANSPDFLQVTPTSTQAGLLRSRDSSSSNAEHNGLWTCRVNDNAIGAFPVGLYMRGRGSIATNQVTLSSSSSFNGDSPTFSLVGETSGGPATTYGWTRNGAVITPNSSFSISFSLNEGSSARFRESIYRSTLSVTGRLPGEYTYAVTNRATEPTMVTDSFTIEAIGAASGLMAEQTGLTTVLVTWTAPSPAPSTGYRVTVPSASIDETVSGTSRTYTDTFQPGNYTVQVLALSQHFPNSQAVSTGFTVRSNFAPVVTTSSPTATSVTISWTQPELSLTVSEYTVSLTRVTGSSQALCPSFTDNRPAVTASGTSMVFTDLQESSVYRVTVTATFSASFVVASSSANGEFTTLGAAPTGAPREVVSTVTSRSIMATWDTILCIERNGEITGYTVEFQEQGGTSIPGEVMGQSFNASGLTPFTNYTFRVAGVNSNGTGPFTNLTTILTAEDTPGPVSVLMVQPGFTSMMFTWSPPEVPNGIIIRYEITYRISSGTPITNNTNLNTSFTILSLATETTVSSISVFAYTSVGRGEAVTLNDTTTLTAPPVVSNVRVQEQSPTSVLVSWDGVDFPELTGFRVYYQQTGGRKRQAGEMSVEVSRTETSVLITNLMRFVEYQFQVVALAEFQGEEFVGNRSVVNMDSMFVLTTQAPPPAENSSGGSAVGAAIGGVVAAIAVVLLIIIGTIFLVLYFRRRSKESGLHKPMAETVRYARTADTPLMSLDSKDLEPTIEEFPEDTHATEGEGVVFKVSVSGKPHPSLTWYRDDTEVVPNYSCEILDDGSLNLPSVEIKQGGVYRLVATNSAGSTEQQVKLTVQFEGEKTPDVDRKCMTFAPVPEAEFGEYVAQNHSNNNQGFRDQFQALESGDEYPKTVGLSPEYKKLNRFANITNYDHNRILLSPIEGHADCEREFINGCYIEGFSLPKKFIATQGPIAKSLVDFWRLVWQERPPTIVMVTNLKEGNKKKCEQYWPDTGSTAFGPFKVTLTEHQVFADYCIRTMQVSLRGSNKPLKLQQYHFTAWPDHGVPDYATPMLAFHRRIKSTHNPKRGPMLVHCSAGVGRTGTFICIDNVLEQIKKEKVVDIAGVINKMRHQRMKMVQTHEQYIFLHDAILESITCGDTQISAADLRMKIKKYSRPDPATGVTTFQSQFDVLEQVSPKTSEVICNTALDNPNRNRRKDHLPSDRFRVLLKGEHPDYIHAVFAHGYKHQKAYMIAEGPMASTVRNMFKILYDRKVGAVVMLSGFNENGTESSVQYWPPLGRLVKFGEYTIDLMSEEALEGFTIRTLSILEEKTNKAHQVTQFHITSWAPNGECSNLRAVIDCIEEVAKIQRRTGNKPIFVHCNDTVTRSGMFCAMATVIDRCKTEGVVDVFQVVKALRVQKPGAVPTVANYSTIFESILTFLDSFDTYANFQNV